MARFQIYSIRILCSVVLTLAFGVGTVSAEESPTLAEPLEKAQRHRRMDVSRRSVLGGIFAVALHAKGARFASMSAITRMALPTDAGTSVHVTFELRAHGGFELRVPTGQRPAIVGAVGGDVGGVHLSRTEHVTISGRIDPYTGRFSAEQKGVHVQGSVDSRGRVSLRQLDIIGKDKVTRRLQKNKSYDLANRANREGPKLKFSDHSMGTLTIEPTPAERHRKRAIRYRWTTTTSKSKDRRLSRLRPVPRSASRVH